MNTACLGAFSGTITAQTNSTARITFSVTSGALPPGTTLSSSGKVATISGTISLVGTYTFVVRATLATGEYAAHSYTIYVAGVANDDLADGSVGDLYSDTLTISGPTEGASTWAVTAGALPAGLSLNASTGEISGTPTTQADYNFTVRFTNNLTSCSKAFSVSIGSALCVYLTDNSPPDGTVDEAYSYAFAYSGPVSGTPVWAVASGSLPDGLSLNTSTGALTGTPTTEAAYSFSISFTNNLGNCTLPYTVDIAASSSCPALGDCSWIGKSVGADATFSPDMGSSPTFAATAATDGGAVKESTAGNTFIIPQTAGNTGCKLHVVGSCSFTGAAGADIFDAEFLFYTALGTLFYSKSYTVGQAIDELISIPEFGAPFAPYQFRVNLQILQSDANARSATFDGTFSITH